MSDRDDDPAFDDVLPTMIDPEVPTGARDRPREFDPRARVNDNRWTPPPEPRPVAPTVLPAAVRPDDPAQPKQRPVGFDPQVRIDDSSRTVTWEPGATAGPQHPRPGSEPIRVVSMKTPMPPAAEKPERERPAVNLRGLSELRRGPAPGMGNLAPPRDPSEVRSRRRHDNVMWVSIAVILTCVVMLAIWFLAR